VAESGGDRLGGVDADGQIDSRTVGVGEASPSRRPAGARLSWCQRAPLTVESDPKVLDERS
jgi:hypothetical protein